jgi:hypothetical protein
MEKRRGEVVPYSLLSNDLPYYFSFNILQKCFSRKSDQFLSQKTLKIKKSTPKDKKINAKDK